MAARVSAVGQGPGQKTSLPSREPASRACDALSPSHISIHTRLPLVLAAWITRNHCTSGPTCWYQSNNLLLTTAKISGSNRIMAWCGGYDISTSLDRGQDSRAKNNMQFVHRGRKVEGVMCWSAA